MNFEPDAHLLRPMRVRILPKVTTNVKNISLHLTTFEVPKGG
jgi:hypothetical protein